MCITANGNISANGNLCFRVFKLHFIVIKKMLFITLPLVTLYILKFLAIY